MLRYCIIFWQSLLSCLFFFSTVFGQIDFNRTNRSENLQWISEDKFAFAILGDRTGSGPNSWKIFDQAIFEINQLRPDFVIMVGDLIESVSSDPDFITRMWVEAKCHLDSLQVPFFLIPGNHDIWNKTSYRVWVELIGDPYFSFDYKNCHFIVLNTEQIHGTGEEGFGSQQMVFIEKDIDAHRQAKQFFIFLHQPVWLYSGKIKTEWEKIESLLGSVQYSVIAGHLHVLASKQRSGQRYLIAGPTGGSMRLSRNPSYGLFHHFTWVTVEGENSTVGFVEPGKIYAEKLAVEAYERYLQGYLLLKGKTFYRKRQ